VQDEITNGDWQSWRRYVLKALEDIREEQRKHGKLLEDLKLELAVLKVKAGFWGSLAGVATATIVLVIDYVMKH
jgi:hypothetical protein